MSRPESSAEPAGVSPVLVGAGAPGSRPRFMIERLWAERGVKSLVGESNHAGRSMKRTLQPRQIHNGKAEPFMSRRRPCPPKWFSGRCGGFPRGTDDGTYGRFGREQERPVCARLVRQETGWIS